MTTERERIARDYGVAPHLVPEPRVIPRGVSGEPLHVDQREFADRGWRKYLRNVKMYRLLEREGKA